MRRKEKYNRKKNKILKVKDIRDINSEPKIDTSSSQQFSVLLAPRASFENSTKNNLELLQYHPKKLSTTT